MKCLKEHSKLFKVHKWLPIKVHYFLMYGAIAGVLPFMPVIGKDLGLSATAVGITYTLLPISIFVFRPLFGYLCDYFRNIKTIIICLLLATVTLLTFIIFISPIEQVSRYNLEIYMHYANKSIMYSKISSLFSDVCIRKSLSFEKINCEADYESSSPSNVNENNTLQFDADFNCIYNITDANSWSGSDEDVLKYSTCIILLDRNLSRINYYNHSLTRCHNVFQSCLATVGNVDFISAYQFWIYTIIVVLAATFFTSAASLSDVACYEILGEKRELYGRQRVWGTVSTGIVTLCAGYFNDLMSQNEQTTGYLAGYFMMFLLFVLNTVLLTKMNLLKAEISKKIISDVRLLLVSPDFVVYGIAVFFIGAFSGLLASYLFWYLKDLGASQTILGTVIMAQCLLSEVPFFFFAGWFIKKLGFFNCLTCSFAAFALRFGLYSIIRNPWLALPIESLHGLTYAVFYASKTAFASVHAPPGTEGTLLGILGAICDGLGYAMGSFLGGLAFDKIGGSRTFQLASILSSLLVPVTFTANIVFKRKSEDKESGNCTIKTITVKI